MIIIGLIGISLLTTCPEVAFAQEAQTELVAEKVSDLPTYPEGLDDPAIPLEELRLRVLPLPADEVAELAKAWRDNIRIATEQIVDQTLAIRSATGAEAQALRAERDALLDERDETFAKAAAVGSSLSAKGGHQELVDELRRYRVAISVEETASKGFAELVQDLLEWLLSPSGGLELVFQIGVVFGALLGLFIVARMARAWARRMFSRMPSLSRLLQGFLATVVYWLTIAFGLMIVLAALGVNVTPLFALVGGASFIIAFAMQETLGNLAAGLMIMIYRPFDEGDYVSVAGIGGTVQQVSAVSTTVTTPDNQVIVVPNSKVWGDVITNVTASETRRVDLVFGVGYDDSIEDAQNALEEVVAAHPAVLSDPPPLVRVNALSDSSVDFVVRPWVKATDYWTVYWDLTRQVKEAFDAKGLTIPYPQTEMTIRQGDLREIRA